MTGVPLWLRNLPGTFLVLGLAGALLVGAPVAAHYVVHGKLPEVPSATTLYVAAALIWVSRSLHKDFRRVHERIDRLEQRLDDDRPR